MKRFLPLLLALTAFAVAAPALAEGGSGGEDGHMTAAPKAKHRKAKPKPKPAAPAKPAGPVPYTSLGTPAATPATPQVVSPGPPAAAMTPDALPQPAETNHAPAPSSDIAVAPRNPPPSRAPSVAPREVSLKCETQVTDGTSVVSHGTFYIDLFPSDVLPNEHADFKFIFVDPAHKSLIRESVCLDTMCSATVTNSAYYLVNLSTRHGGALRITLDRSKGAFYAEQVADGGLFAKGGTHLGEQGYCTPQALPTPLF
jgi:hypothetical protein